MVMICISWYSWPWPSKWTRKITLVTQQHQHQATVMSGNKRPWAYTTIVHIAYSHSVAKYRREKIRSVSWVRRSEPWSLTCGNPLGLSFTLVASLLPSVYRLRCLFTFAIAFTFAVPCLTLPYTDAACRVPGAECRRRQTACNDLSGKWNRSVTWGRFLAAHSRPFTTSYFINTNTWWILKRSPCLLDCFYLYSHFTCEHQLYNNTIQTYLNVRLFFPRRFICFNCISILKI